MSSSIDISLGTTTTSIVLWFVLFFLKKGPSLSELGALGVIFEVCASLRYSSSST